MYIQRLKDKLGNTSNASSEVEYDRAVAWPVGELGRGVPTIINMVSATRLDCVLGSAAAIRQATVIAANYARHRQSFGAALTDHPAMTAVIADLTVESEAATTLAIRLAGAADRAARGDAAEAALLRVALPAAKYWICKRTPMITGEALECLGGNGYIEDYSPMPRLLRDAPLNSIWEGSGNVTALDVLRALTRTPDSADALLAEIDLASGDPRAAAAGASLRRDLKDASGTDPAAQRHARRLAGQITLALQASLLARHAPGPVWNAFSSTRLGSDADGAPSSVAGPATPFGSLPDGLDLAPIMARSAVTSR
jgi:putative acyl-CoA dehydrogenase